MEEIKEPWRPVSRKLLSELKVRHLANLFIIASVFVILGTTLYPFDFTTDDFQQRLTPFLHPKLSSLRVLQDDVFTNIILFVPIGIGFAIIATRKRLGIVVGCIAVVLAGATLSLTVELAQLFLPFRYSSLFDVASNALGSTAGFVLYKLFAHPVYWRLRKAVERGNEGYATGWLIAIFLLYTLGILLLSPPLQSSSLTNEFNKDTFPLVIGNEPTGDRPWSGSIKNLIITRHRLSVRGVAEYLSNNGLNGEDTRLVVAHFIFSGRAPYKDLTRLHSPLEWRGKDIDTTESDCARITEQRWLQTKTEAYEASSWIMETKRFTICFTAANNPKSYPEKARIVSISGNPYQRNFSILQLGNDLGVRFRSMTTGLNGTNPQFIVPNVFADTLMHRIVVALNVTNLHVYIDSVQRHYQVELGPGFALLNRSFPSSGKLDISSPMKNFHNYLFDVVAFVPLAYILGLLLAQLRTGIFLRLLVACIGIALPPVLLEEELQLLTGRGLIQENLAIGFALMFATTILTLLYHKLKPELVPF